MRFVTKRLSWVGFLSTLLCATLGVAHAQECGDSDGSGTVTVTDGVNVLRQAAGLSSTCTEHASQCDVDSSGTVTVTDGVNVLRRAAELSAVLDCRSDDSSVRRFAGRYQGTFSGEDRGTFDVDFACDGDIEGFGISTVFDEDFDITGTATANGDVTLTVGSTSSASTFRGTVGNDGRVSGHWSNAFEGTRGSFQGARTDTFTCSSGAAPSP